MSEPLRVIALRPDGTWHDVSTEVALQVVKGARVAGDTLPAGARNFVDAQLGRNDPHLNLGFMGRHHRTQDEGCGLRHSGPYKLGLIR